MTEVLRGEHVECGERLVEEEHLGMHHECPRKADALLHPAGELLGERFLEARQTDELYRLFGARPPIGSRKAGGQESQLDVVEHREPGKQRKALEHDGDLWIESLERHATNQHATFGGRHETRQDSEQRRFAGTRWPEQRYELAVAEHDIDVVQYRRSVVTVILPHILRRQQYIAAGRRRGRGRRWAGWFYDSSHEINLRVNASVAPTLIGQSSRYRASARA